MSASALDRLATLCGIAPRYLDTSDVWHDVPDATRRSLIEAMGIGCRTGAAVERSIAAIEAGRWRRRLPPVAVAWAGRETFDVAMTTPADEAGDTFEWRLALESGRELHGRLRPGADKAAARRSIDGRDWIRVSVALPVPPELGYHRLALARPGDGDARIADCLIIGAPASCYRGSLDAGTRLWGLTAQLYSLRSDRNWGIGDFTDLCRLVEYAAAEGAAFVGLNPLHAPTGPCYSSTSPYAPSSRRFLNPLYLDVEAVPDFIESDAAAALAAEPGFRARLERLRTADLIDYPAVAECKLAVLEHAFRSFCERHLGRGTDRGEAFGKYRREQPELEHFAVFAAIDEAQRARDPAAWGWPAWPPPLRDRHAKETAAFAAQSQERVAFHAWLQWNAELQLEAVATRAAELGMPIGVYTDLALSADPGGADTWIDRGLYLDGAQIGAPPDDFNQAGQDWGLPAWHPEALRAEGYRPFVETLRAGMRRSGALRIDHVMSLLRLFLVPAGQAPTAGAYVYYDFEEFRAILALESQRNRCIIIGEDLGTVPDELREGLTAIGALGYRVLFFEKNDDGAFRSPAEIDREALTVVSTHDLPTLTGYWSATDIEHRVTLDLFATADQHEQQMERRAEDRAKLLDALDAHGFLPGDGQRRGRLDTAAMTRELSRAFHAYLAASDSLLAGVQVEDLLSQVEQVNLPGTTDQHPNWRRRLPLALERWPEDTQIETIIDAVRSKRPGPAGASGRPRQPARPARAIVPRATYRLQLNRDFTFAGLAAVVPYLARLGVSHCYCSPYLMARAGSMHGYDVVDHGALNAEIGSAADFGALTDTLSAHGLGQILDMVPNHMAVMGHDNAWWLDVLEHGRASRYASFFDIDWRPLKQELAGKVLVPVLGDHYGNALDNGELRLVFDAEGGAFRIEYYEHWLPLDPRDYPRVLERELETLHDRLDGANAERVELESLIGDFSGLPHRDSCDEAGRNERAREAKRLQRRLAALARKSGDIRRYVGRCLVAFNGDGRHPADAAGLHTLLESQAYRLAFWRVAADEINYRRFFDINELAAVRVENPEVFDAVHDFVLELIAERKVDGLRIDHPDGLYDPQGYIRRLQARVGAFAGTDPADLDRLDGAGRPLYVVVEKILAHGETLRKDWPVHGTTGYEFAVLIDRLLIDADGMRELESAYRDFIGERTRYEDVLYRSKRLIMSTTLASELNALTADLDRLAERDPHTRDYSAGTLRDALLETIARFPVYRTYQVGHERSPADEAIVNQAIDNAKGQAEAGDTRVFDFLRDVLLGRGITAGDEAFGADAGSFVMRLQQFTSPVAAKGMEDTAFYRYARLISLNEVGGTPDAPPAPITELHAANQARQADWPHAMLASSTHDAKRSEDVRARLDVLSELGDEWHRLTANWRERNETLKHRQPDGNLWPDRQIEYFLYQTLLGTWPPGGLDAGRREDFTDRVCTGMIKAAREAKRHTSWVDTNAAYESALTDFARALIDGDRGADFLAAFEPFAQKVAAAGLLNSLTQLVLKMTSPGVPDFYQGNELWRFDLVDPDNRRPVDFDRRERLLDELEQRSADTGLEGLARELMQDPADDRLKLFVTWRGLRLRREHPALFSDGDYRALRVDGNRKRHVVAFSRWRDGATLVVAAMLRHAVLGDGTADFAPSRLGDTTVQLPPGQVLRDALTGREIETGDDARIRAGELFAVLPCAMLIGRNASRHTRT